MEPPLDQYVGSKLFYSLGLAMTSWAHVQIGLLGVFHKVSTIESFPLASTIFYTPINDSTRADMVDNAIKISVTDPNLLDQWDKLRRQVNKYREKRNLLAHFMSLHDWESDRDKDVLTPSIFSHAAWLRYKGRKGWPTYNAKQVMEIASSFGCLARDLEEFAKKIPPLETPAPEAGSKRPEP
jgi:hypothetical protein